MLQNHDTEEDIARIVIVSLALALYMALWLYGGASWASAIVSVVLGTVLLLIAAAPLGAAVFILVKLLRWLFTPRAQP